MKKLLLSCGFVLMAASLSATTYTMGTKLTQAPTSETKVIIEGWTQASKGFMTNSSQDQVFAILDKSDAQRIVFTEDYVYTIIPVEGSTTEFYIQSPTGLYAPISTKHMNVANGAGYVNPGVEDISEAGIYEILTSKPITTQAYADKYMFRNTNQAASGMTHMEVHFGSHADELQWCYLQTGDTGMADAGNATRTACAFALYIAEESATEPVDVTFNYPNFGGFTTSKTVQLLPGEVEISSIPSIEYFTITGVEGVVGTEPTTLNVTGTWNFPFVLNNVYRLDIRKKNKKFAINSDNKIATNTDDGDNFDPKSLFYLKGHGFNNENHLKVTLHSIYFDDNMAIVCPNTNNGQGTFTSENPTEWIVRTSVNGTNGILLEYPTNSSAHANDVGGSTIFGLWTDAASRNDVGSFIRFNALTEEDFANTTWTNSGDGLLYMLDSQARETAKNAPTSQNIRNIFESAIAPILTVNFKYRDVTLNTVEINDLPGTTHTIAPPVFFNDSIKVTIQGTNDIINHALNEPVLPFKYTENTDNMIWQVVQQHSSYKGNGKHNYTWTFTESESNTIVAEQDSDVATKGFRDTQLWAFVGNYNDGFTIYNKVAGTEQWLYSDGTNAKIGTGTEKNIWKVYPTNDLTDRPTDSYCCFKTTGSTYINLNVNTENGTQLTFWSHADQGSSIWFSSLVEPTVNYINTIKNTPETVIGAHSGASALVSDAEAAMTDAYNPAVAENLRAKLAEFLATPANEFDPNCWYRLRNTTYNNEHFTLGTNNNIYGGEQNYMTNHNSIVKFVPVADKENRYYILSQGNYVGHITQSVTAHHVEAEEDVTNRGEFKIDEHGYAAYTFTDVESSSYVAEKSSLHHANHGGINDIVGWGTDAGASQWYIVLAESVEVALDSQVDGMNVGFGYFPFPVRATNDGTKLYYVDCGTHNTTNEQVVTYAEVQTVPAHTAFMIGNEELTSTTLAIDYNGIATFAATATPGNLLNGTLRSKAAEAGDFTFGPVHETYGFTANAEAPTVSGNSAYLPKSALPEEFQSAVALPFSAPGHTTKIAEINAESNASAAVYDLQGRKLAAPAKGINIINGKKVLVK